MLKACGSGPRKVRDDSFAVRLPHARPRVYSPSPPPPPDHPRSEQPSDLGQMPDGLCFHTDEDLLSFLRDHQHTFAGLLI